MSAKTIAWIAAISLATQLAYEHYKQRTGNA
jgi:hypothetical protein